MSEAVSLKFELTNLQRALLAAEDLCRSLLENPDGSLDSAKKAASAVAVIGLVESRLQALQSAVAEEIDPRFLLARWNVVPAVPEPGEDPDVRLAVWTVSDRLSRARDTVERLERRLGGSADAGPTCGRM